MGSRQAKVSAPGPSAPLTSGVGVNDFSGGVVDAVRFQELEKSPAKSSATPDVRHDPATGPIKRTLTVAGVQMASLILQFDDYIPMDLVNRPANDKSWFVYASDGPGCTCRPATLVDAVSIEVTDRWVTATFPGNVRVVVPTIRLKAAAGIPLPAA